MKLRSFSIAAALLAAACSSGQPGADGTNGTAGTKGANGETPAPPLGSINQISPRAGLVDRNVTVIITADQAKLDASAKVDFGDGIAVSKVVANPAGGIQVELTIAADAKLGARDVTVKTEAGELLAKKGFVVAVPLDTKIAGGKAEQGGLVRLDVSNRDKVWFDVERFTLFPLVPSTQASLVALAHQRFTATDGSVVLLGDPLAKAGPLGFLGVNDPEDQLSASFLSAPDAVTISSRTPETLASGTTVEKTFLNDLETGFFEAVLKPQTNEGLLVDLFAKTPADSTMAPLVLAYPESGRVKDLIDQKRNDAGFPEFGIPSSVARVAYPVTGATKGFFIVLDAGLGHGPTTKLSLQYTTTRALLLKERTGAHDTAATAQNIGSLPGTSTTIPGRIVSAELAADGEVDLYSSTGLSATNVTDMQVSVLAAGDVVVSIDKVATFDSPELVEFTATAGAGSAVTAGFVGPNRYIRVTSAPNATAPAGKYSLGVKRLPNAP